MCLFFHPFKALEVKASEAQVEDDADESESVPFDGSVFKAAMYSEEPGMVREVLECVQNNLTKNKVNRSID